MDKLAGFSKVIPRLEFRRLRKETGEIQCSPANPAQAGEEAIGLADLSGLPSSFCVLVGE